MGYVTETLALVCGSGARAHLQRRQPGSRVRARALGCGARVDVRADCVRCRWRGWCWWDTAWRTVARSAFRRGRRRFATRACGNGYGSAVVLRTRRRRDDSIRREDTAAGWAERRLWAQQRRWWGLAWLRARRRQVQGQKQKRHMFGWSVDRRQRWPTGGAARSDSRWRLRACGAAAADRDRRPSVCKWTRPLRSAAATVRR